MRKITRLFLGVSLAVSGITMAAAQDQATATMHPPKYIQVRWNTPSPARRTCHDKTESAFVAQMASSNSDQLLGLQLPVGQAPSHLHLGIRLV